MTQAKARSAVFWSALDTFLRQGVSFFISIILARLLLPEDFGTVALLAIFMGIANLFVNMGLGLALIQRQDITHTDESTVFWFNLLVALVMTLGLIALAPWIADFFDLPVLVPLTRVLALTILLSALGTIHGTLMTKRLDFRTPMKVGVTTTLVSGGVAITMAWAGYGLWALAGQSLAGAIVGTSLLWLVSPWRPRLVFSAQSFKRLFGFSGWLFLSWMFDVVYQRGYTLLIGKFYGTYDLGIYNRADSTQTTASGVLTDVVSKVAFPLFSSVHQDLERMRRGMRLAVRSMMLITAPSMFGLAVLAEPFIIIVFGENWVSAAPILQVLCVVGLFYPLHVANLNVLQAQGYSRLFFKLEIVKKMVGVTLLVTGSFFGIIGIALARSLGSFISLFINGYYTGKYLDYGMWRQLTDCASSIVISLIMAAILLWAQGFYDDLTALRMLGLVVFGAIVYIGINFILRAGAFTETYRFVTNKPQANI